MAEFVVAMLVHTPVWVYVLLVFLLFRGLKPGYPLPLRWKSWH